MSARSVKMHLAGATDESGLAYQWTPYRWHRLRLVHGVWRGGLPAPALRGIYPLQFRLHAGKRLLHSPHWLLRVFAPGTHNRPSFPNPADVIRHFVRQLPGDQVLIHARRWPQASFDRRDPRLNRIFVIAYAPRGNTQPGAQRGLFITTIRNGFNGQWSLLQATVQPYS
jgi:hypothetical protein